MQGGAALADAEAFDPATNRWSSEGLPPLRRPRAGCALVRLINPAAGGADAVAVAAGLGRIVASYHHSPTSYQNS